MPLHVHLIGVHLIGIRLINTLAIGIHVSLAQLPQTTSRNMIRVPNGMHRLVGAPDYSRLHRGHAPGGPQDRFSCELGNRLVGNQASAAAIEFTLLARAAFTVDESCEIIIAGAPCQIEVRRVRQGDLRGDLHSDWTRLPLRPSDTVQLSPGSTGCRVYVCVAGGLDPSNLENTYSLSRPSSLDQPARTSARLRDQIQLLDQIRQRSRQWLPPLGTLRIVRGPDFVGTQFDQTIVNGLQQVFEVSSQSSGMGLRLTPARLTEGPIALPSFDIASSPVTDGTIQATEGGLIALLRQRGTLGGYARIATVIDVDIDRLAQFRPGNQVRFAWIDAGEASRLMQLQQDALNLA